MELEIRKSLKFELDKRKKIGNQLMEIGYNYYLALLSFSLSLGQFKKVTVGILIFKEKRILL